MKPADLNHFRRVIVPQLDLFKNDSREGYAIIKTQPGNGALPIRSKRLEQWLAYTLTEHKVAPTQATIRTGTNVLESIAVQEGETRQLFVRVGEKHGSIYIDLADDEGRVIEVSREGWRITTDCPVAFLHPGGMLPLPVPAAGGSIDDLRPFVNADSDNFKLITAWLVAAFRNHGPYPVLAIHGEPGSAKSTMTRVLRDLIDPNHATLRTLPKNDEDLPIAAQNGWVLAFDNVSVIQPWLSDLLCRIATGGGFGKRARFTDASEVLFKVQRPVLLNGIGDVATRSDLLDRALVVNLPAIPSEKRRDEGRFWRDFEAARPRIIGALLAAAVVALRDVDQVNIESATRMIDFQRWISAAEPALGWEGGEFAAAYARSRGEANVIGTEAVLWVGTLQRLSQERPVWQGTGSELLTELNRLVGDERADHGWPKNARYLSEGLRRLQPNLRAVGINIEFKRQSNGRLIVLRYSPAKDELKAPLFEAA